MSEFVRRLPVYLLLDCSESVAGEPFEAIKAGLHSLISTLQQDPMALETAALSVIGFSGKATELIPLTDLTQVSMPRLRLGSGTALGSALSILQASIERDVRKNSATTKGDYKPNIFLLTDGRPTDSWMAEADKVRAKVGSNQYNMIAVGCGDDADLEALSRITPIVIRSKDLNPEVMAQFFQWVSASVTTVSTAVSGAGNGEIHLPNVPDLLEVVPGNEQPVTHQSDRFVFLHLHCVKTRQFYLMRFERRPQGESDYRSPPQYDCVAVHPVEDFDFESSAKSSATVSSAQLHSLKACPYCNNPGYGMCVKGHTHCSPGKTATLTCPVCNVTNLYEVRDFGVGSGAG
ncbi:MAG: VWA domain-containing protein [Planctomycetaceae bacterium]|nr:VWA domain-containing protein [Planctomycetaceae bacterium]